jgi:hypothetical protein
MTIDHRPFARVVTAACFLAITVLSLTPKAEMIRTGAPGPFEHALAYGITGLAFGTAVSRPQWLRPWLFMASYAVLMELGQFISPGRTPSLMDASASAAGAMLGLFLVWQIR